MTEFFILITLLLMCIAGLLGLQGIWDRLDEIIEALKEVQHD